MKLWYPNNPRRPVKVNPDFLTSTDKWFPKKREKSKMRITPDFSLRDQEIRLACEKQDNYPVHLLI